MNLENLRRKRVKRLGIKSASHAGQRRVFFILDRATKKHHGDLGLWLQYLNFARKQKARKAVSQILTTTLRLHPTHPELWTHAARCALDEQGDINEARSYIQRGLRFCKHSEILWSDYLKLEMSYIAKIDARCRVLGLDTANKQIDPSPDSGDFAGDIVPLPTFTTPDVNVQHQSDDDADRTALQRLSPLLSGAIPTAIFDAAFKQSSSSVPLGTGLFDALAGFRHLPCTEHLLQHFVDALMRASPKDPRCLDCFIRQPFHGLHAASPVFPKVLNNALDRLNTAMQSTLQLEGSRENLESRADLALHTIEWLLGFLEVPGLDQDVLMILNVTLKKSWIIYQETLTPSGKKTHAKLSKVVQQLQARGFEILNPPELATESEAAVERNRITDQDNSGSN